MSAALVLSSLPLSPYFPLSLRERVGVRAEAASFGVGERVEQPSPCPLPEGKGFSVAESRGQFS
jgi:hypothetical protein